ncbi:hypothetical protein F5879DRAFT_995071 [Lentinula edodes]|uniref:uncharacterized protein n=1 Tax=Lentinula edodes TaxID=5353 RepID=UPI001E8DEF97|nr:uncharacterized protein C8R40DRAFT_1169573 [Lentinula edodes]KAH7876456.1 hypothetical protein C8R40DRAFT_1169573 [Lentinula edodes]KAJ3898174.1 hypothetical protein F5879DRAFT_995071 [Lentinula edodes]KAJ3923776.1 hypothetical protein F5877DRAFT_74113 [Lentinula edodes]
MSQFRQTGNAMHICLVKKYKGPCTPILSSHSSRPSFDALKKQLQDEIRQAPANHQQAKDRALYRDGYRCVATKIFLDVQYSIQGYHEDYQDTKEL